MFLTKLKLGVLMVPVLLTGMAVGTSVSRPTAAAIPDDPPAASPRVTPPKPALPDQTDPAVPNLTWSYESPGPVATIYGDVRLTREEFGEFLIKRYGEKALERFVNKRIIEIACERKGITLHTGEVEAAFREDLAAIKVSEEVFVNRVLKQYDKTLMEWKEDVIKPRLLLSKLGRGRIAVTEDDLQRAFDHRYGPKVSVRLIGWPKGQEQAARQVYEIVRGDEAAFDRAAKAQNPPPEASGGRFSLAIIRPEDPDEKDLVLVQTAFRLKPGEVSPPLTLSDGRVVLLKCDGRIPPDESKDFETERSRLFKEVIDRKVQREIPKLFETLKAEAKPQLHLKP